MSYQCGFSPKLIGPCDESNGVRVAFGRIGEDTGKGRQIVISRRFCLFLEDVPHLLPITLAERGSPRPLKPYPCTRAIQVLGLYPLRASACR